MESRPFSTPPPGHHSNFENPPNEAALAYTTLALALATVTFFAWFRFLVKLCIMEKLHVEDYLIPFAWATAIVHIACGFVINSFAPIIHSWDMTMATFFRYIVWYRLSYIFYNVSIVTLKIAMLIQVRRIFVPRGSQSKTYFVIHGLIWMNALFYTVVVFLMVFGCRPFIKAWQPATEGKCVAMPPLALATAVVNLVGDMAILFVTQKVIWGLMRVERRQRLKLSVVFFAGVIPCGFAIMCLYYNDRESSGPDFTRDSMYMSIACYGEIASGMFVLFLPVVPKFFSHLLHSNCFSFTSFSRHKTLVASTSDGANGGAGGGGKGGDRGGRVRLGRWGRAADEEEGGRKKSVFHISYSGARSADEGSGSRGSEERLAPARPMAINVVSTVSVRSEEVDFVVGERGVEMGVRS